MKPKICNLLSVALLQLIFVPASFANIHNDMNSFFQSLSETNNTTAAQHYQSQSAGYYTGGSLVSKNGVRRTQLASVTLPSLRAGCGGIDLFTGGFSYINAKKFIETMKNIMNNASGFAFQLALDSVTPMISGNLKYFQDLATKINNANINSCETAVGLVGGLMPRTQAVQRQVCATLGTQSGIFSDWAAARQGCGSAHQTKQVWRQAKNNPEYTTTLLQSGNLAWQALQNSGLVQDDSELATLFMAVSGTVIVDGSGKTASKALFYPSLIQTENLLQTLLQGGRLTVWHCSDKATCIKMHKRSISLSSHNAFFPHVRTVLANMVANIRDDKPLSHEALGLLKYTRLPIYKVLQVQLAFYQSNAVSDLNSLAEVVATDVLFKYLSDMLDYISTQSTLLNFPENISTLFEHNLERTEALLRHIDLKQQKRLEQYYQIVTRTQHMEKYLANQLTQKMLSTTYQPQ